MNADAKPVKKVVRFQDNHSKKESLDADQLADQLLDMVIASATKPDVDELEDFLDEKFKSHHHLIQDVNADGTGLEMTRMSAN